MGTTNKVFSLILTIILVASSLLLVPLANAQSIPKPSVPEFTIRYADYSYSVPPAYGVDEYTGQNRTISHGYDVINRTVLFTIKNQPFNGYYDSNGNYIQLYYHIRYKGSYGDTWSDYSTIQGNSLAFHYTLVFHASNSSNSDVSVYAYSAASSGPQGDARFSIINLPSQGKIDFQVQTLIGYGKIFNANGVLGYLAEYNYNFTGQAGDWSPTQTLSLPDGSVSISTTPGPTSIQAPNPLPPNSFPTPTVPELSWLAIVPLLLATPLISLILLRKKTS
jgi:hypothetical protein